ncbi:MAG: hypothetical protein QNJ90_02630 [Planctomycetota bacterium]|nr:hypothetical protein [Planctomycetota bacterium]
MVRTRVPATLSVVALLMLPLALGGCVLFDPPEPTAPRALALNRDTPKATYEYFKTMVSNNQWAAEWSVFSPNFKRLLNQSVGRNVDAGDYNLARTTVADNSQGDMQLLLGSTYVGEQMVGPNAAVVTIEAGGRRLSPRLVRLTRWELQVVGDETPYGDFVTSAGEAVRIQPDGSVTVMIRPPQSTAGLLRTFRPDQIEAFRVESQWYLDDFGGLDATLVEGAGDGQPQPPRPQATPQPQPRPQPAPTGWGSPDGAGPPQPPAPPPGWGSPDGPSPVAPRPPREAPPSDGAFGWGSPDG